VSENESGVWREIRVRVGGLRGNSGSVGLYTLHACGGGTGLAPGRPLERAVPVPCRVPGMRPRHGLVTRAVPARAQWPPGRAVLGQAKTPGLGPGHRASCCMAIYDS
jgi:hypothetical protein